MHLFRRSSSLFMSPPLCLHLSPGSRSTCRSSTLLYRLRTPVTWTSMRTVGIQSARFSTSSLSLSSFVGGSHTSAFFSPLSCEEMKAIYTRTYGFLQMYTHSYMHLCSYLMIFHTYYESFDGLGQLAFGQWGHHWRLDHRQFVRAFACLFIFLTLGEITHLSFHCLYNSFS